MKTRKLGIIAAAMALGLGGLTAGTKVAEKAIITQQPETKAVETKKTRESRKIVLPDGLGLGSTPNHFPFDAGTPPHIYGRYHSGQSKTKRSNRNRFSHNAKLKRRSCK